VTLRVAAVMEPAIEVASHATLADIEAHVHAGSGRYLRTDDGWETFVPWLLVGIPRTRRVIDVPRARCKSLDPNDDALRTLQGLELLEPGCAPVVDGGRLLGQVTREQLRRALGESGEDAALTELRTLRAGMAALLHDMSNALMVAQADRAYDLEPAVTADALTHAGELVGAARLLLQGESPSPLRVELGEAIRAALPVVRSVAGERIGIEVESTPGTHVFVTSAFVHRLLINLVLNVREALDGSAGTVRIRAEKRGEQCVLEISDDGPGIAPWTLARVLEPGFSTKGSSGGRGMGLAGLRSTLQRWGGQLEVESDPGRGTTVSIRLPQA
jgi:signal transduction histidine kinase